MKIQGMFPLKSHAIFNHQCPIFFSFLAAAEVPAKLGIRWRTSLGFEVMFWAFIKSQILFRMTHLQALGSSSGLVSISCMFIGCREWTKSKRRQKNFDRFKF